jgi:hypothetical protein
MISLWLYNLKQQLKFSRALKLTASLMYGYAFTLHIVLFLNNSIQLETMTTLLLLHAGCDIQVQSTNAHSNNMKQSL